MPRRTTVGVWIAEGLVILVSILLAFAIDASWDSRQERRLESAMVSGVIAELKANQVDLQRDLSIIDLSLSRIERFMALTPSMLEGVAAEDVPELVRLSGGSSYSPNTNASNALLGSPASDSLGLAIREAVGRWVQQLGTIELETAEYKRRQDVLQHQVAIYASRYPTGGLVPVDSTLSLSRDPALVSELRADDAVVAAVVDFGSQQWFYRRLLERSQRLSDSALHVLTDIQASGR